MNAYGAAWVSAFNYSWEGLTVPVPGAYIIHQITSSGLNISWEEAWYTPSASVPGAIWGTNICNWRFDFQNRSSIDGSIKQTWSGLTQPGCNTLNVKRAISNIKPSNGLQCARLFTNGVFRGEQCHSVH